MGGGKLTLKHVLLSFVLFTAIALASCAGGSSGGSMDAENASLAVTMPATNTSRAVWGVSDLQMFTVTVASHHYKDSKTAGQGETVIFSSIPQGVYKITIIAKKTTGEVTAKGESTAVVSAGEKSDVTVMMHPLTCYTVSYYKNRTDNEPYLTQKVTEGYAAPRPESPVKAGNVFSGWYASADGGVTLSAAAYNFDSLVGEDIRLYAKWGCPEGFVLVEGNGSVVSLYVCDHEVTQGEYETYCTYGGGADKTPSDAYGAGTSYPAYFVSWYDALVYCNKRSIAEGVTPVYSKGGNVNPSAWGSIPNSETDMAWDGEIFVDTEADGYRLPTEVEWEYVARGGLTPQDASWRYSGSDDRDSVLWCKVNSSNKIHVVKSKAPNSIGIYDMSGNASEWCFDTYSGSAAYRVTRGGSWNSFEVYCKVSETNTRVPYCRDKETGFRVVRLAQE